MSLAENMEVVQRIVNNTTLPVSADIEAGYATSIEGVVKAAHAVLNVGAVGLNIEDGTGDSTTPLFDKALQQDKIKAMREMAVAKGIHMVINARTDVYLIKDASSRLCSAALRKTADAHRQVDKFQERICAARRACSGKATAWWPAT